MESEFASPTKILYGEHSASTLFDNRDSADVGEVPISGTLSRFLLVKDSDGDWCLMASVLQAKRSWAHGRCRVIFRVKWESVKLWFTLCLP